MLGSIIYKLRAENSTSLQIINGRLMHAVFFKILHDFSTNLEKYIHDKLNIKPFTVSFLNPLDELEKTFNNYWKVSESNKFYWRVTTLNEAIFKSAIAIPIGYQIQVANLILSVEDVICEENTRRGIVAGSITKEKFIAAAKNYPEYNELDFKFLSPTTFRIDDFDAPYPRPELIFASLVDKWIQTEMPATIDKKLIREIATKIQLTQWQGQSDKIYFGKDRGTFAFWGEFNYNLKNLSKEERRVFLLLAKFAEYSGVGRLSAQGFGQTRIKFA